MVEIEILPEERKLPANETWQKLMGNDLVMQVIDKAPPEGAKEPQAVNPQDTVLIDFIGRVAENRDVQDGPIFQNVKGWLVVVGDGDVLPAVEMAIRFMETGQTARVWAHSKYAFGAGIRNYTVVDSSGAKKTVAGVSQEAQVPPHANVCFEIKVTMIVMDTSRLNPYFTIQKATARKNIANDIYQHEWCPQPRTPEDPSCETAMNRALRLYTKAAKAMETLLQGTYFAQVEENHPQKFQTQQLLMDCLNNIVAVHLRQQQYHKAKLSAVEVLKLDPNNLKGLMRAAKAALLDTASTMEEVHEAIKAAESQVTYKNPAEEKQLKQLKAQYKKKQHEYKAKAKEMFGSKLQHSDGLAGKEEGTTELDESGKKPAVSFAEPEHRDNDQKTSLEGATNAASVMDSDSKFWQSQLLKFFVQVIVPILLFFVYRMIFQAKKEGEATLAYNDGKMPVIDEEIIDLDK